MILSKIKRPRPRMRVSNDVVLALWYALIAAASAAVWIILAVLST
jgi:hypothetical protein